MRKLLGVTILPIKVSNRTCKPAMLPDRIMERRIWAMACPNWHLAPELSNLSVLRLTNASQDQRSRIRSRPLCRHHSNREDTLQLLGSLPISRIIHSQASLLHQAATCFRRSR